MRYLKSGEEGPRPGRFDGGEESGGRKPNRGLKVASKDRHFYKFLNLIRLGYCTFSIDSL